MEIDHAILDRDPHQLLGLRLDDEAVDAGLLPLRAEPAAAAGAEVPVSGDFVACWSLIPRAPRKRSMRRFASGSTRIKRQVRSTRETLPQHPLTA